MKFCPEQLVGEVKVGRLQKKISFKWVKEILYDIIFQLVDAQIR